MLLAFLGCFYLSKTFDTQHFDYLYQQRFAHPHLVQVCWPWSIFQLTQQQFFSLHNSWAKGMGKRYGMVIFSPFLTWIDWAGSLLVLFTVRFCIHLPAACIMYALIWPQRMTGHKIPKLPALCTPWYNRKEWPGVKHRSYLHYVCPDITTEVTGCKTPSYLHYVSILL